MFGSRMVSCRSYIVVTAVLLLAGLIPTACIVPEPAVPETPMPEPVVEDVVEVATATVNAESNVRAGPGTEHAVLFWLPTGTVVGVTGRNDDGSWLHLEHEDRKGWIFRPLTDIAPEVRARLPVIHPVSESAAISRGATEESSPHSDTGGDVGAPAEQPTPMPTPVPVVEPEPTPPTVEPEPTLPAPTTVTVTGTVVNLRLGPGTGYGIDGQAVYGDVLRVLGRNAAGDWLQVMHPVATGELVWIYGPLTDLDGATVQTLAMADPVAVEIETPPTSAPEPVVQPTPAPAPQAAAPTVPADCPQLHTVNPNETRLSQITDWFGLDLQAVAALNGIAPDTPLTTGWQLCLSAGGQVQAAPTATPIPITADPLLDVDAGPVLPHNPRSLKNNYFALCAVQSDGTLGCWGDENFRAQPPPGTFESVRVGHDFACALRTDGSVACWGQNHRGQASPPTGNFLAIDTGHTSACGLRADRTLACWGSRLPGTMPSGTFLAVGTGNVHTCAIRTDGTLVCWGRDDGHGETSPPSGTFKTVRSGASYSCAIRTDGTLACWGRNESGQSSSPGGTFSKLDVGIFHSCAIRTDGTLACWGDNAEGQSSPPGGLFRDVACGFYNTCAVRADGSTICWGSVW